MINKNIDIRISNNQTVQDGYEADVMNDTLIVKKKEREQHSTDVRQH